MKKVVFLLGFIISFEALQIISGWVLTLMYQPEFAADVTDSQQTVDFGTAAQIPALLIALVSIGIGYVSMRLFEKRRRV